MKAFILIILLTLLTFTSIFSQSSVSLNFLTAFPVGDFGDYSRDAGIGGNLEFFFFTPSEVTPYGLGINLSYLSYGADLYENPYTDDLELSFDRANNFASAHIIFQIAPYEGSVRPYFETLFGGSYIYFLTEIGWDYDSPINLWIDDWAWSYGAGVGLKLFLNGNPFYNSGSTYLDFKVRYLKGTSAEYLDQNSIEFYGDDVYYSVLESNTDMLTVSMGIYFFF